MAAVLLAVTTALLAAAPGTASAHNALVSSDPADGATLPTAPTQITWVFDKAVPLETMTVTLIDATGVRTELSGSTHGPAGDTVVVTPLPAVQPGPVSLRWRLVGPDGHPITGRVDITVASPAPATSVTAAAPAPTPAPSVPSVAEPRDDRDGPYTTSSAARWVLRYVSYAAIMAIVGILVTSATVWVGAGEHPLLRRILSGSLFATAALGLVQLLVLASDVSGAAPWSSLGSIDAATTTDAGMALALRIVLAVSMWIVLFRSAIVHRDIYWTAVSLAGLGLLGTWAFAGHSRSMRWPAVGVLTDVAHHAAAGLWIAGLAIVGWIVIPSANDDVVVPAVRRFSTVAAFSVATLVVTGVIQTVRLVGSPLDLFDATHGRLLLAKVAVLGAMLAVANVNRRRLAQRLSSPAALKRNLGALRRAVLAEFAIGMAIVGITAAMVVSPPSTQDAATPTTQASAVYYAL
jgi:copper transport protein